MADETSTDPTPEPAAEPEPEQDADTDKDVQEIAAKAENPDAVSRALKAEREAARKAKKELEAALARVKEFEDRDKTDQERLAGENARLKQFEGENLRLRVAMEKNLPAEFVDRLRGDDREGLEADADSLIALVTKTSQQAPRGSADLGARGEKTPQISRSDLDNMTSAEIVKAQRDGRLDHLLRGETS